MDDFGVKYVKEEHAQHLLDVVKQYYKVTDDLGTENQGDKFIGITLEWDYEKRHVHLSMPGYVPEALIRFKRNGQVNCRINHTKKHSPQVQTNTTICRGRSREHPGDDGR